MQKIIQKLKAGGIFTEKVSVELDSFWFHCVEAISEPVLKSALIYFLEEVAPIGFFVNTASASGKHHPIWQVQEAGILRNTTECCIAADRQLRIYPQFTDEQYKVLPHHRDIVVAATILSDTFKYGDALITVIGESSKMEREHGKIAADKWWVVAARFGVAPDVADKIYTAVYWHLGRWTVGWTPEIKFDLYTKIVHRLDMIFADKNLELLYDPKSVIEKKSAKI